MDSAKATSTTLRHAVSDSMDAGVISLRQSLDEAEVHAALYCIEFKKTLIKLCCLLNRRIPLRYWKR